MAKVNTQLPDKDAFHTTIATLESFSYGIDTLSDALTESGHPKIAKMVLAGRIIERGWIIATRDALRLRPIAAETRPGHRKSLAIQIDRVLWAEFRRRQSIDGTAARELANMYLSVGLKWPAHDIPLDLTILGYGPKIRAMLAATGFAPPVPALAGAGSAR